MIKLNLGCGDDKRAGYVNCDIRKNVNPDKVVDLTRKLPFQNDSIDEVYMRHVIEHVPNYDFLIKEIWRVCKNKAKVKIKAPFYSSQNMLPNPNHINYFGYYTLNDYRDLFIINPYINFFIDNRSIIIDKFINWKPYFYQRFFAWSFPASQIVYNLEVIKSKEIRNFKKGRGKK